MNRALTVAAVLLVATTAAGEVRARPAATTAPLVFTGDGGTSTNADIYLSVGGQRAKPIIASGDDEFDPVLSRDGRVAYARAGTKTSEIFVYNGGQSAAATHDGAVDQQPSFSLEGDSIAYASDRGSGADIMEVRVGDPSSAHPIAAGPGDDLTPAYAPDGWVAFASNRSGNFELYLVDPQDQSGRVVQLTKSTDTELAPSWSPDGSKLVFERVDRKGNANLWVLAVAQHTAGKQSQLTFDASSETDPSFSPDATQIAFVSDRSGTPSIWTMPARPKAKPTRVPPAGGVFDLAPSFGPTAPHARSVAVHRRSRAALAVTCPVAPSPYLGNGNPNTINGTDTTNDTICGLGGNDTLSGKGLKDNVLGGDGADHVHGNAGYDPYLSGGASAGDLIYGETGNDWLFAKDGKKDTLDGGGGVNHAQWDAVDVRTNVTAAIP